MLPTPISIPSVNKNTARAIISALLSAGGVTRGELAARCGVSAMTAGKVVSAMCAAGYAAVAEEISAHGRVSDFIYPAESITFLVFDIGAKIMSADVIDAKESTRFSYAQPRNHGVDTASDVSGFISIVREQLADSEELNASYRLSALLYHAGVELNISDPIFKDISLFSSISDAKAQYVKKNHPKELVAFVSVNEFTDISLVFDGELIRGKQTAKRSKAALSELDMLNILTARLSSLFELVIPNRVIIDSRSLNLSRRFSSELGERLMSRTDMQKEELPELVTNDGISFPSRAVIGQLIDIYAEIISAN